MSAPPRRDYLGASQVRVNLGGAPFRVFVHLGMVDGRAACVGLDIQGFEETHTAEGAVRVTPHDGWQPLTARRLRELRVEEVVEEAREALQALIDEAMAYPGAKLDQRTKDDMNATWRALEEGVRPRRPGRPAALTDQDLVDVVVRAYLSHRRAGGRSPVVAVREALERSGVFPDSTVTIGQARAAVRRARSKDLLPEEDA